MTINAIISVLTSIPFRTRRRFDNPSHCRDLFLREIIFMRVLTFSKETLREIIFVARFLWEIADKTQDSYSVRYIEIEGDILLSGSSRGQWITARSPISCFFA